MNRHHMEVFTALAHVAAESGTPSDLGDRIRSDRRSSFEYLGLRTPDRRRRVKQGFSFTADSDAEILAAWNEVWTRTNNGDVLFTPLDYYRTRPVTAQVWATVVTWIDRIDNWAHADDLARVYSRALEASPDTVYPTLLGWSRSGDRWACRISIVSLIRYSGKNAAFMPADAVLDLVANCVSRPTRHRRQGGGLGTSGDHAGRPAERADLPRRARSLDVGPFPPTGHGTPDVDR